MRLCKPKTFAEHTCTHPLPYRVMKTTDCLLLSLRDSLHTSLTTIPTYHTSPSLLGHCIFVLFRVATQHNVSVVESVSPVTALQLAIPLAHTACGRTPHIMWTSVGTVLHRWHTYRPMFLRVVCRLGAPVYCAPTPDPQYQRYLPSLLLGVSCIADQRPAASHAQASMIWNLKPGSRSPRCGHTS